MELQLSDGRVALIDRDIYEKSLTYFHRNGCEYTMRICDRKWRIAKSGKWIYPSCTLGRDRKKVAILLHRLIMGAKPGDQIDHVNGDRLDNRRENLRFCETWQNLANMVVRNDRGSSRFKGVHYDAIEGRWRASISFHGKKINLGDFASEETAAVAYNTAAKLLFGGFANLNNLERSARQ